MRSPIEVIYCFGVVLQLNDWLVLLPGIYESHLVLIDLHDSNIVMVVLIPGYPQQLIAAFIQYITFRKISNIELPPGSISSNSSEDMGVRGERDVIHLLIVCNQLFYRLSFVDIPDRAGCVD